MCVCVCSPFAMVYLMVIFIIYYTFLFSKCALVSVKSSYNLPSGLCVPPNHKSCKHIFLKTLHLSSLLVINIRGFI